MTNIPLDEVILIEAVAQDDTGAAVDADSTPTFAIYEETTDTDIGIGGNMTKRTSLTGQYRAQAALSAANGFEVGKCYSVYGFATIGGIAKKAILMQFRVVAAESTAGTQDVNAQTVSDKTGYQLTAAYDAAKTAAKAGDAMTLEDSAITASKIAADALSAIAAAVEAAILDEGDATPLLAAISAKVEEFLINDGDATATLAAIAAAVRTALTTELARIDAAVSSRSSHSAADVKTALESDGSKLDHVWETTEDDGAGTRKFTAAALVDAPTGGGDATQAKQDQIITTLATMSSSAGPGSRQFDFTVEVSGTARPGVSVWISTDSPYTTGGTVAGTLTTDDAGQVTFYLDDDVTYYLWRDSSRFNFTDPIQFRYSSADAEWQKWNGSAWEAWT